MWLSEPIKLLQLKIPSFAKIRDFIEGCISLGVDETTLGGLDEDRSASERLCLTIVQKVVAPGPAVLLIESARWMLDEGTWQRLEKFMVTARTYKKKVVLLR
jgi:hypothetical protein